MNDPAGVAGQAAAAARLRRAICASGPTRSITGSRCAINGKVITARYTGVVPDKFKNGAEVVLKGTAARRRLRGGAQRRDGEVSVEVQPEDAGDGGELDGRPRIVHAARHVRRRRLRARRVGGRRAPPIPRRSIDSGVGAFYLTAGLLTVASAVILQAFVDRQLHDQIRAALFRLGAAAGLQDRVLLGRARRVDPLLGVPAVGVRHRRGRRQPRASPRADSVGRRRHRRDGDVLHLHHGGAQQSVRHLSDRRRRPKGAASIRCCRTSTWRSIRRRSTRASSR